MRELEPVGTQLNGQLHQRADPADVPTMQHDVDRQRQRQRRDHPGSRDLAVPDAGTCDLVGRRTVGILDAELNVIEPRLRELGRTPLIQAHPAGDQVDVETEIASPCD
jgi:hypothetical protein